MGGQALARARHGTISRQLLDRLANVGGRDRGRQRFPKSDGDGVRQSLRPFPEELPAPVAEDTAPELVQAHGNNRRWTAPEDLLEATMERKQKARPGNASLGKNTHDLALTQDFGG